MIRRFAPAGLVAAVFWLTVELLRAVNPLLDLWAGRAGVVGAAGLAVLIFVLPAVLAGVLVLPGVVRGVGVAVAALVGLRLVAQSQSPPTLLVVGVGAAVGVAALVLAVRAVVAARGGVTATAGVLVGTIVDLAVRSGYGSWDPIFRPGLGPWLVVLVGGAAAVLGFVAARPVLTARPAVTGRVGMLGPYLALYALGYGSAPILAAHGGVSLAVASALLIGAAILGREVVRRLRLPGGSGVIPEPDRWFAGAAALLGLVGGVTLLYWLTGPAAIAGGVLAGLAAAVLLARALTARAPVPVGEPVGQGRQVRAAGLAGLAAGFGYLLPVLVYQVHYDLEFPFDNRLLLLAAAVAIGLTGLGARPAPVPAPTDRAGVGRLLAPVSLVAVAALLVPAVVVLTRPAPVAPEPVASVRLLSWNVAYARHHTRGEIDFESIAATIEAADPDLVLLQEVSRGWPIGGGADLAEWLGRRLGLPFHWSPAADGQFGNLLLSRVPVAEVSAQRLPFLQGPMERSYVAATLTLTGGQELRVINTHLQHRKVNTPTRLRQSEALHAEWGGAGHTVIAGDFNFWPSWQEPRLWAAAGFVSAQDISGQGGLFTGPAEDPNNRVDWIFGTPDLTFSDFEILTGAINSDHFPLVVTVRPAASPAVSA